MPRELDRALLQWVNTFSLDKDITGWTQFEDGQVFWQILKELDSEFFQGGLPETNEACKDNWIPRWKNVQHVHHSVLSYTTALEILPSYTKQMKLDLKAIASDGAVEPTIEVRRVKTLSVIDHPQDGRFVNTYKQILKLLVYAALSSEKSNERQVELFQTVGINTFSAPIQKMFAEMTEKEKQLAQESSAEADSSLAATPSRSLSQERTADASRDKEEELLNMEAKWYETMSVNNDLQVKVKKLEDELDNSHRQIRNLEEQMADTEQDFKRRFEEFRERERQQHLNEREMSDKDLIAQLESDLAETKAQMESQNRQLTKLKADAVAKQDLRDKLQLLQFERDELAQKAKANENLKKKIQSLQETEKKYHNLVASTEGSRQDSDQYEDLKQRHEDLKRANQESLRTIQSCEQQIMVEAERNKILQHEKRQREQELDQTREMMQRQVEIKEDLENKLRELENSGSGSSPRLSRLEDELAAEDDSEMVDTPRIIAPGGSSGDILILQQKLDLAEARAKRIEDQYLTTYEENIGLQQALTDVSKGTSAINQHPSVRLQDRLHAAEDELKGSREQQFASSAENATLRDQLSKCESNYRNDNNNNDDNKALADCILVVNEGESKNLLDSATAEDFTRLRANHEKLLRDHATLEQHNRAVIDQLTDQKSLLRRAMLKRISGEDELLGEPDLYQQIKEQISIPAHAPANEREELIEEVSNAITSEIGKLKVSQRSAICKKSTQIAPELQAPRTYRPSVQCSPRHVVHQRLWFRFFKDPFHRSVLVNYLAEPHR